MKSISPTAPRTPPPAPPRQEKDYLATDSDLKLKGEQDLDKIRLVLGLK